MALVLKLFRGQRGNRYGLLLGNYLTCVLIALFSLPDRGQILQGEQGDEHADRKSTRLNSSH